MGAGEVFVFQNTDGTATFSIRLDDGDIGHTSTSEEELGPLEYAKQQLAKNPVPGMRVAKRGWQWRPRRQVWQLDAEFD